MNEMLMMTKDTVNLRGELRQSEPMSRHTSWRVGGPADYFYIPVDTNDLSAYLQQLPTGEKVLFAGLGSNLLVRDGGLRGSVICLSGTMNRIDLLAGNRVRVEAGVACPKFARFTARSSLSGAEFMCGIPGTIGGALAMNAGALGSETWDFVESVETMDFRGALHTRTPQEYQVSYRHVAGPEAEWFVAATFRFAPGDAEQSMEMIKKYLARRSATQPTQQPNAGSVFRNPQGDYAARLIESCGLKGTCIGGACVSEKHANFIINTGTATAADIESLIEKVHQQVLEECKVDLLREVQIIGEYES